MTLTRSFPAETSKSCVFQTAFRPSHTLVSCVKGRNVDVMAGAELKLNTLVSHKRIILALIPEIHRGIFLISLNCLELKIKRCAIETSILKKWMYTEAFFAPLTRSFPM